MTIISFENMKVRYEYIPSSQQSAGSIVLLHSLGLSMNEFDEFVPHLNSAFHLLRFDMLGHGESDSPEQITVDVLAKQVQYMVNQFIEGTYYVVAGPGMGYVATRFCRSYNPTVSGLVMISPQPTYISLKERQQIIAQVHATMSHGFQSYRHFLLAHFTNNQDALSIATLSRQLDQVTEHVHLGLISSWLHEDFINDFVFIDAPILVLAGTQDLLFPSSTYGVTASYIEAELKMIPDAGHLVAFDNPKASANAVLGFIDSVKSITSARKGFSIGKEGIAKALKTGFSQGEGAPSKTMHVYLLTTFQIQIDDVVITRGWNLRKVKSIFLYLLLHGTVTRDEIMDVFWPDLPIPRARNQLRMNLHFLKSILNQESYEFLYADREHVFLKETIHCDATDYIQRLNKAYSQMLCGDLDLQVARDILEVFPKKLLTHLYDDWYLDFRNKFEMQYCALCKWTYDLLNDLQLHDEGMRYYDLVDKLRG